MHDHRARGVRQAAWDGHSGADANVPVGEPQGEPELVGRLAELVGECVVAQCARGLEGLAAFVALVRAFVGVGELVVAERSGRLEWLVAGLTLVRAVVGVGELVAGQRALFLESLVARRAEVLRCIAVPRHVHQELLEFGEGFAAGAADVGLVFAVDLLVDDHGPPGLEALKTTT